MGKTIFMIISFTTLVRASDVCVILSVEELDEDDLDASFSSAFGRIVF